MQKRMTVVLCGIVVVGIMAPVVWAGETGHYPLGVEGLKAGSLPPPGLYSRNYLLYYHADVFRDSQGDNSGLGTDIDALVFAPRLIWITDKKILGADYGMDALLPIPYQDVELNRVGMKDNDFCIGDLCVEPIDLAWHGDQWDLGAAYALWFPTGKYDRFHSPRSNHLATPGKDFWTNMFTFGGTYFFDAEKTWHASALGRYEIHSHKDHTDVKPGQDILMEWGVGKTLAKIWDIGVVGYAQWQLTNDSGSDVTWDRTLHDRVAAIGPEVSVFIPPIKSFLSVRAEWEFSAVDRPEGTTVVLTFTKIF